MQKRFSKFMTLFMLLILLTPMYLNATARPTLAADDNTPVLRDKKSDPRKPKPKPGPTGEGDGD